MTCFRSAISLHYTLLLSALVVTFTILQLGAATKYSVSLNSFEQKDCKTKCQEGLLAKEDNLFLTGKVMVTDHVPGGVLYPISLQWRENQNSKFHDLYLLNLDQCNKHDTKQYVELHEFYCEKTEDDSIFNIYLNMTANTLLSEKEMMLIAYISLETSKVIKLPKIYDANSATLTINGQVISEGCSNVQLDETTPNIKFCCQGTATPCEVTISHAGVKEVADNGCVSYSVPSGTTWEFTFKSVVCGQPHLTNTYKCNFKQNQPVRSEDSSKDYIYVIIFTILAVIVIIVAVSVGILIYRSAHRGKKQTNYTLESAKFKQF